MTEGNREPEAVAPNAAEREELRHQVDERERRADERDRVADERDRIADERDQIAHERDRIADVREWQLAEGRAPKPGDVPRWRREVIKRERQGLERALARVARRDAQLDRENAERKRTETEVEHETAQSKPTGDDFTRTT